MIVAMGRKNFNSFDDLLDELDHKFIYDEDGPILDDEDIAILNQMPLLPTQPPKKPKAPKKKPKKPRK